MSDKIWLGEYPPGVPAEIDSHRYTSLNHMLLSSCETYADRPSFANMGVEISYARLAELTRDFAACLQQGLGLQRGDRIALMMPNLLQYPVAMFGALRAGLIVVNVNPLYSPRELRHQLRDSGARAIVILENFAHTLEQVMDDVAIEHVIATRIGDMFPPVKATLVNLVVKHIQRKVPPWSLPHRDFRELLAQGAHLDYTDPDMQRDDIAFLQYTGGTTGEAKGAMLTHGNLVANLMQTTTWLTPLYDDRQELIINALPLYHIFSLLANCLTFTRIGGMNVLITNPRDFQGFVKTLRGYRFTGITGVNTLFNALLNTPGFDKLDFSRLKIALGGGMAMQRAVAETWQEVTGHPVIEAYGLTETSPAVCFNPVTNRHYNGSVGVPLPSTEVVILDAEGEPVTIGETGELCIKGPQVMKGYWNRPDETRDAFTEDGWLRSGDMAHMDELGYVFIEDRKKDMILVSGFNVYPNEVEDVIAMLDEVDEVAVVGIPDARSGEAVKAFIVSRDKSLSVAAVIGHCRRNLAAYKVPHQVEFRDELPKTNVGKVLRRLLRDTDTSLH